MFLIYDKGMEKSRMTYPMAKWCDLLAEVDRISNDFAVAKVMSNIIYKIHLST